MLRTVSATVAKSRTRRGLTTATAIPASEAGQVVTEEPLEPDGFPQVVPSSHPAAAASPTVCTAYLGEAVQPALGTRIEISQVTPEELSSGADALEVTQQGTDPIRVAQVEIGTGQHPRGRQDR